MNLVDHNQQLPPGLMDTAVEFFLHDHEIKCLYNGKVWSFNDFPQDLIDLIEHDMLKNPKALKALADWDITDPDEQMRQYIGCRFGGFDNHPDISPDGHLRHSEYINCGRRGKCPHEGKLCASIKLDNGFLTSREIEVLKLIGEGYLDKEIIDKLAISQDTLRSHKDNISAKAGIHRKSALAVLAYKLNLI